MLKEIRKNNVIKIEIGQVEMLIKKSKEAKEKF